MKIFLVSIIFILLLFCIINKSSKNRNRLNNRETFSNFNNIKIYFINLDEQKDRWNNISKITNKLKLNIHRFPALNGKKLNETNLIKDGILHKNHRLKKGQLGCAYSHFKIWQKILNQNERYGLVLEDDVLIPSDIHSQINEIFNNLPSSWDIIYLGGCNIKGKRYNNKFIIPTENTGTYNLCTHAMLINKANVYKLINILTPIKIPIDEQLKMNFKNLNVFFVYPNIINQNKDLISIRRVFDGSKQSKYWKENHTNVTIV